MFQLELDLLMNIASLFSENYKTIKERDKIEFL